MNDRLKFRIWDDIRREMINLEEQDSSPYNVSLYPQNHVMQCTGIKDCNGKDIYEGDIVRLDDELKCVAQFHKEYDMGYGRIEFILIGGHPKCPTIYIPTVAHESEIIGNIYTTPELLEEKE